MISIYASLIATASTSPKAPDTLLNTLTLLTPIMYKLERGFQELTAHLVSIPPGDPDTISMFVRERSDSLLIQICSRSESLAFPDRGGGQCVNPVGLFGCFADLPRTNTVEKDYIYSR